ncbi:MAG: glycine cleavage T C-terminal barrel domain-containing protein, partial [Dehalococcoidia bacterium]|nr:glycine cleavage T C-terminal barrel domain-containing protein [Dehalococcoidia bacterium]
RFLVVNNAANAELGHERVGSFAQLEMQVELERPETVMLALQGPEATSILAGVLGGAAPERLPKRHCAESDFGGGRLFISRTGYTGEDGFELVGAPDAGRELLRRLVESGVAPCGLGARDTLRLEAALPLYGNDIDTTTNPWEAGLGFAVSLDDEAGFAGRGALAAAREAGVSRKLACLRAAERGIMRAGYVVLHGGEAVSRVTSGGFSPTLNVSIAMAYLPLELAEAGTELTVEVRGRPLRAVVVARPFYRRKSGAKRP